jgi:hypothetical protein
LVPFKPLLYITHTESQNRRVSLSGCLTIK